MQRQLELSPDMALVDGVERFRRPFWTVPEAVLLSDAEAGNAGKQQCLLGYQATRLFWRHKLLTCPLP
jgi:hypothetical protein